MLTQRWRLLVTAALLTPPLIWWGWGSSDRTTAPIESTSGERIDFFVVQAEVTRWQDNGAEAHRIQTRGMHHLMDQNLTRLDAPEVQVPAQSGTAPYRLRADTGRVPDSHQQVELAGNVLLHDNPHSGSAIKLSTERLTLFPSEDRAHTDQSVLIQRGQDTTEALGMDVYFKEQRIELLSDVKGLYHAP